MSKLVAIVGDTGSGKSTGIEGLDPKSTYIINVGDKELPFKGSEKLYNAENKNYKVLEDAKDIANMLKTISDKAPHIKNVIIEDGNYIMAFTLTNKALETGFTKFTVMAKDMIELIKTAKKLRPDLVVYYFSHQEPVFDGEEIVEYKMKTAGKAIDSQFKLEGLFTTVLYAVPEERNGVNEFNFVTNKYKKYPAKTPKGMFNELKIPNNLQIVADAVNEYYK